MAAILSFVIKMFLLNLFAVIFGFHVVICNLMALTFSGLVTFIASEKYIFKEKKQEMVKNISE